MHDPNLVDNLDEQALKKLLRLAITMLNVYYEWDIPDALHYPAHSKFMSAVANFDQAVYQNS